MEAQADLILGTDGAYSAVRKQFMKRPRFNYQQVRSFPHVKPDIFLTRKLLFCLGIYSVLLSGTLHPTHSFWKRKFLISLIFLFLESEMIKVNIKQ